jgi:threonine dehydratase
VIGSEPNNARDGFEGLKVGKRVTSHKPNTIADGLRTTVGKIPFEILKSHLDKLWLASEEDIRYWFYTFLREERMVVEPSCVVPIAAADQQKNYLKGKRIVIVITGGNVDFDNLP